MAKVAKITKVAPSVSRKDVHRLWELAQYSFPKFEKELLKLVATKDAEKAGK